MLKCEYPVETVVDFNVTGAEMRSFVNTANKFAHLPHRQIPKIGSNILGSTFRELYSFGSYNKLAFWISS